MARTDLAKIVQPTSNHLKRVQFHSVYRCSLNCVCVCVCLCVCVACACVCVCMEGTRSNDAAPCTLCTGAQHMCVQIQCEEDVRVLATQRNASSVKQAIGAPPLLKQGFVLMSFVSIVLAPSSIVSATPISFISLHCFGISSAQLC